LILYDPQTIKRRDRADGKVPFNGLGLLDTEYTELPPG
jgi:hypothetical protein